MAEFWQVREAVRSVPGLADDLGDMRIGDALVEIMRRLNMRTPASDELLADVSDEVIAEIERRKKES